MCEIPKRERRNIRRPQPAEVAEKKRLAEQLLLDGRVIFIFQARCDEDERIEKFVRGVLKHAQSHRFKL